MRMHVFFAFVVLIEAELESKVKDTKVRIKKLCSGGKQDLFTSFLYQNINHEVQFHAALKGLSLRFHCKSLYLFCDCEKYCYHLISEFNTYKIICK